MVGRPPPPLPTLRHRIAWSYANLARAHAALDDGATRYKQLHHIIRARLFAGLCDGRMSMRSLYDDERLKMTLPQCCAYCGSSEEMSLDHLIPRLKGGETIGDNLVYACRRCNGAKGARDLLEWMEQRRTFPSLYVLRRYLKLAAGWSARAGLLDIAMDITPCPRLPFAAHLLPLAFPPLEQLTLAVAPGASPPPQAEG